jgi:hypothetical protein
VPGEPLRSRFFVELDAATAVEIAFGLFVVLVFLSGARFMYFWCFTKLCLELGWERAPFQKLTGETKRDFGFNSSRSGSFNMALFVTQAPASMNRIFFRILPHLEPAVFCTLEFFAAFDGRLPETTQPQE